MAKKEVKQTAITVITMEVLCLVFLVGVLIFLGVHFGRKFDLADIEAYNALKNATGKCTVYGYDTGVYEGEIRNIVFSALENNNGVRNTYTNKNISKLNKILAVGENAVYLVGKDKIVIGGKPYKLEGVDLYKMYAEIDSKIGMDNILRVEVEN